MLLLLLFGQLITKFLPPDSGSITYKQYIRTYRLFNSLIWPVIRDNSFVERARVSLSYGNTAYKLQLSISLQDYILSLCQRFVIKTAIIPLNSTQQQQQQQ